MSNNFNESVSELKPDLSEARLRKRYRAETRFRIYGIAAILFAIGILALLLGSIITTGFSAFTQTEVALDIHYESALFDPDGTGKFVPLSSGNYRKIVSKSLRKRLILKGQKL